jgi:hypothetical protein
MWKNSGTALFCPPESVHNGTGSGTWTVRMDEAEIVVPTSAVDDVEPGAAAAVTAIGVPTALVVTTGVTTGGFGSDRSDEHDTANNRELEAATRQTVSTSSCSRVCLCPTD